jgi:hypothetical protein
MAFAQREPDYVKAWLTWSMNFAPDIQAQYRAFETRLINALADMFVHQHATDPQDDDIHDRARMIVASSAFLAKMVFDGVSEKRRQDFINHVLQPLAAN